MASSLSRQLASIAATSTNQLDLRAQRHAHSQSLLFEAKVAATQDFETIYDHCIVGFQELCRMDSLFVPFSSTIFSEASKSRERGQMTSTENTELDAVIERFLTLSSKYLLLAPTQKALEWLVRRFRIHEYSTETLVLSFLIYHPLPVFSTLLSILPKQLPKSLKFLHPYRERLKAPSGEVLQHATNTNPAFFDGWTAYVLKSCKWGFQHEPMISYWTIRVASAIASQLEPIKSGGVGAQRHREEDVVRKITAILEKALTFRRIPSMIVGCIIIIERLVIVANLNDVVVSTFMEAIVMAASQEVREEAFVGLINLAQELKIKRFSTVTVNFIVDTSDVVGKLGQYSDSLPVGSFAFCLAVELIHDISKKNNSRKTQILLQLLRSNILDDTSLEAAIRAIIKLAEEVSHVSTDLDLAENTLPALVLHLSNNDTPQRTRKIVDKLIRTANLSASLISAIEGPATDAPASLDKLTFEEADLDMLQDDATTWTSYMPTDSDVPSSYFIISNNSIFDQLSKAFTALLTSHDDPEAFLSSEFLARDKAMSTPTFVSFFMSYASLPFPPKFRAIAIACVSKMLRQTKHVMNVQAILPYVLVGLADPSATVRTATVDLALCMQSNLRQSEDTAKSPWTVKSLYGRSDEEIAELSLIQLRKIVGTVLVPSLEECKMDRQAIGAALRDAISGTSSSGLQGDSEKLKKTLRATLLSSLTDQARMTSVLRVALGLIELVSGTSKAGSLSSSEAFKPLLEKLIAFKEDQLQDACTHEKLGVEEFCSGTMKLVIPSSAMGNKTLQRFIKPNTSKPYLRAILNYTTSSWASMTAAIQADWALLLFQHGVMEDDRSSLNNTCLDALRSLPIQTDILEEFIKRLITSTTESDTVSPNTKRRKTNTGAVHPSNRKNEEESKTLLRRSIALLELIRNPESTVGYKLLPGLFNIFQAIHKIKSVLDNELTYLHWLLLICLREVVQHSQRSELRKLDHSEMRIDLIVDTLTHTTDPQTQYSALMLLSTMAKLEPELIIHSMMPVFTFLGSSILKQDDEHATCVVDQTINSVIPPLIESFRQHKGGALPGASGLILSFAAAFEHILPSRRLNLFSALIDKLGAKEYLFVLFVVLQDRLGGQDAVHEFISAMLLKYSPAIQIYTIYQCITILKDSTKPRPKLLKQIFVSDEGVTRTERAIHLAELPSQLLREPQLKSRIAKILRNNTSDAEGIRSSYADMVQDILEMTLQDHEANELSGEIAEILGNLVSLFPVSESLRALNVVLQQPNEELHREVLHSFAKTIDQAQMGDLDSRDACFTLFQSLLSIVGNSKNTAVKVQSITCIEAIIKKYGKTDANKTLELTLYLTGSDGLQSTEIDIQLASLKVITTSTATIGEDIVPLCPVVISKSLDYLSAAISGNEWHTQMHNTVFSLFNTLFSIIPWTATGDKLERFLELSYKSASASVDASCDEHRVKTLLTFAKRSSLQICLSGLSRTWSTAVELGNIAASEHLQILDTAIEKNSKATIVSHAAMLTDHFIEIMNLRASWLNLEAGAWDEIKMREIEDQTTSILIKMIYKLNDTHFRPQFARISEWATDSGAQGEARKVRRLTSWFAFLHKFFQTLQSIVTNYTTYVIDPAVEILNSTSPGNLEQMRLWEATIDTLHASFEHDQDDFWKSPSRFSDICGPLVNQFGHFSIIEENVSLIPCITAFAVAVESTEQRAEIHARILQHSKAEDAHVRRAMFRCQIGLTEALGDEWISLFESSSTYPVMSEALEDDDEDVENEARKWKLQIEEMTGESLDSRLQ